MLGTILTGLLYMALLLFILGLIFVSFSKKIEILNKFYDKLFYAGFSAIIIASAFHLYNLVSHNFQFYYVANYSSRSLPFFLNLSSFYAGQEGSFLFWTLCASIIGFPIVKKAKTSPLAKTALAFYSLNLIFLALSLVFKSPFQYIWEVMKVKEGFMPQDGNGLNPILENVWMVIHPPVLFIGFALSAVPFSFALSALINKEYNSWILHARKWILSGSLFLGVGLALGGVWAYETLGWGGFWAWDPVENSSLIPWLFMVALTHTIIIQRKTGGLKITNVLLAIMVFVTSVYSTFLTRSGVLANFSVHSFESTENISYYIMLVFLAFSFILGIGLLIPKIKALYNKESFTIFSREYFMTFGIAILSAFSLFVLIGISLPIIGPLYGAKPSLPGQEFYENIGSPAMAVLMLFAALSFVISWKANKLIILNKIHLIVFAILSIIGGIVSGTNLLHTVLLVASFFSFLVLMSVLVLNYDKARHKLGPYLSHIGLSVLFAGIVYHGAFKQALPMALTQGESTTLAGMKLTFKGKERIEANLKDREKYKYLFELGEHKFAFNPIVYWSNFNRMSSPFFEPAVRTEVGVDYYLSPKSIDYKALDSSVELKKGESGMLNDSMKIEFSGYDMSQSHSEAMSLGAVVKITINGKSFDKILTFVFSENEEHQAMPIWENIEGSDYSIAFKKFIPNSENMGDSKAVFGLAQERISFDFEKKPMIPLVWAGFVFTLGGFLIALSRKKNQA